jgi:uncharacterized protein YjhX (UPF0386 family)
MNVSKSEQRALYALAQGGVILLEKEGRRIILSASCVTRDGWYLSGFSVDLFRKLKRRRLIASKEGGPYRITRNGLSTVRAQLNNR